MNEEIEAIEGRVKSHLSAARVRYDLGDYSIALVYLEAAKKEIEKLAKVEKKPTFADRFFGGLMGER